MSSSLPSTTGNAAAPPRGPSSVSTKEPAAPPAIIVLSDCLRIRLFLFEDAASMPPENRIRLARYPSTKAFSRVFGLFGLAWLGFRTFGLFPRKVGGESFGKILGKY